MKNIAEQPVWWDYAEFYPHSDEDGYDGQHDGGLKGIKENAPEDVKKAYEEYTKEVNSGVKI